MNSPLPSSGRPETLPGRPGSDAVYQRLIADVRLLVEALREAEFKAGFVQWNAELLERKSKIAADLDALLQVKLDELERCLLSQGGAAVVPPSSI
jgi:hypothetical protein